MNKRNDENCGRGLIGNERFLGDLKFEQSEQAVLFIARYYFQSFAMPDSHAWISALSEAERQFGSNDGARIAAQVLEYVQSVRVSRRSTFMFSAPDCAGCSTIVTEHERRLIASLSALKQRQSGSARMELLMLCEGNEIERALVSGERLNKSLGSLQSGQTSQRKRVGAQR